MKINELYIYHKRYKKYYLIKNIEYGIGEIMRKYDKRVPDGDGVIDSITLWDRPEGGKLKKHKFCYFPNNKWNADIGLLDLSSITNKSKF